MVTVYVENYFRINLHVNTLVLLKFINIYHIKSGSSEETSDIHVVDLY